jgi:peptidoglycan/LPS O-acetylase OafA/YrhL
LSVEEHFYLFLPGTLFLLGVRRARWFVPLTAFAVAGWRFVDHRYDLFQQIWPTLYAHQRTDRTIDGLLWGATLAFVVASHPVRLWLERHLTFAVWTGLIALYVTVAATEIPLAKMFEGMLIPLILFGTVIDPLSPVGRVLENRTIRWLGRISYSIYIWQTLFFVERFHRPALWQTFPYNVAGVISCACISYYLIERPMIALGHRLTMPAGAESNRREAAEVAFEGARGDTAEGAA